MLLRCMSPQKLACCHSWTSRRCWLASGPGVAVASVVLAVVARVSEEVVLVFVRSEPSLGFRVGMVVARAPVPSCCCHHRVEH